MLGVVLAIVAALGVGILLTRTRAHDATQPASQPAPQPASQPAPQPAASISMKSAQTLPKTDACFANNAPTKATVQAQPTLGEDDGFWTSYIYDVPAGTSVDVSIATYDGSDTVTGSLAYSDTYGRYNFTAKKQSGEWRYTDFVGCR